MVIQKIPQYVDSILTREDASAALRAGQIEVGWYTNQSNSQSVVHSHPYYEIVLPVAGSVVRYSIDGSIYDLHVGEMIIFPAGLYHAGVFNITDSVSKRMIVQINADLWAEALYQSGLEDCSWHGQLVILDADAVALWDLRGLFERMAQSAYLTPRAQIAVQRLRSGRADPAAGSHAGAPVCHAPRRDERAGVEGCRLPAGQLHRPAADGGAVGKVHLHQPRASVPRFPGVHAGKCARLPDEPADAALPQRDRGGLQCAGCVYFQRFYELQQLFKELPPALRRHPQRVPCPIAHHETRRAGGE